MPVIGWTSRKRLCTSLAKLLLIIAAVFSGFYALFEVVPSRHIEIRAGALSLLPALDQPREPGPRIIFRLDDVERGVREQQVFDLLDLFQRRGVPLVLGIIPYANGRPTHALPEIKPYLSRGVAQLAVHGVTHQPYEFHTGESGTEHSELVTGLRKRTAALQAFYGVRPVAFLVPYDVFDRKGYEAVRDAGFRILSSQWQTDGHRGTAPVDYASRPSVEGLYRLPSVDDAVSWDAERRQWGDFQPLSNLLFSVRASLAELDVAVLSLHPAAFTDANGDTDKTKLEKLDTLLTRVRELGRITTFRNWYCTHADPERTRAFCS